MTEDYCESVRMSAMAARDGEAGPVSAEQVADHLRRCPACRVEVRRLADLADRLDRRRRRTCAADLRPRIAAALQHIRAGAGRGERRVFAVLAVVLAACKLADCAAGLDGSLVVKLVSLGLVGAAFWRLGTNPFAINPDLTPEGA